MARGDGEREPVARESGVVCEFDGEHGRAGAHAADPRLDVRRRTSFAHLRPLVDAHAPLEQPAPQAEREPRRLHGRVQPVERRAAEERGGAARADLLRARAVTISSGAPSSRHARTSASHEPSCDSVVATCSIGACRYQASTSFVAAPGADAAHGVLGRAAHRERRGVSRSLPERVDVVPERLAEAAVPAARAVPADGGLENDHVEVRLEREQLPGRPEPEVAAADDDDVRARVLLERPRGHDRAGLLEPPAVSRVAHARLGPATRLAGAARARTSARRGARLRSARRSSGSRTTPPTMAPSATRPTEIHDGAFRQDGAGDDERCRAPEQHDPEHLVVDGVPEDADDRGGDVDRHERRDEPAVEPAHALARHRGEAFQSQCRAGSQRVQPGSEGWRTGFEPATTGTTTRGSTN